MRLNFYLIYYNLIRWNSLFDLISQLLICKIIKQN
ncbi:unnamed protein product [Aphis gossypii]|uniref:Uncharacterized protein n=1 Tax=Aphis gossypii TaxID=80765 RepID=A0A9P0J9Y7_APHGO|nr:unnamed protein product [Aphis gossypii]